MQTSHSDEEQEGEEMEMDAGMEKSAEAEEAGAPLPAGEEAQPEPPMSALELLRHRIIDARKKNLSLLSLSRITRVSYQTVLNFVNGRTSHLSPNVRRKLEEFFRISTGDEDPGAGPADSAPPAAEAGSGRGIEYPPAPQMVMNTEPIPHLQFLFADNLRDEIVKTQALLDYWTAVQSAERELASEMKKLSNT